MSTAAIATRQETAVATTEPRGFLIIETFKQAMEVAEYINKSALVPDAYRGKPADIVIAMQYGMELGLSPMQALHSVAVINGKPSIYGDAVPAIVVGLPECEDIIEYEPKGDEPEKWVASCSVKRRGKEPKVRTFSWQDAKKAGLAGKSGPWTNYPKRMLLMRARGFAIRDAFPDRMKGMIIAEEAMDYPTPEPSEPRRVGESATPAAAAAKAAAQPSSSSPPASRAARETEVPTGAASSSVAPTDAASPASPAPASAAASVSSPSNAAADQIEAGVKVLNTTAGKDGNGLYYEVETSRGVFHTRDETLYRGAASCEGAETPLLVTWRWGQRKKPTGSGMERIKILLKLALDEGVAAQQGEMTESEPNA